MLRWSLCLVLLGTLAPVSLAFSLETLCLGRPSGTLMPNPRDCNSYYVCKPGPSLAYCDHGLHFDRVRMVCNWPQLAGCQLEEVEVGLAEPEEILKLHETSAEDVVSQKEEQKNEVLSEDIKTESSNEKTLGEEEKAAANPTVLPTLQVKVPLSPEVNNHSNFLPVHVSVGAELPYRKQETPGNKVDSPLDSQDAVQTSSNSIHFVEVAVVVPSKVPGSSETKPTQKPNSDGKVGKDSKKPSSIAVVNVGVPLTTGSPQGIPSSKPSESNTTDTAAEERIPPTIDFSTKYPSSEPKNPEPSEIHGIPETKPTPDSSDKIQEKPPNNVTVSVGVPEKIHSSKPSTQEKTENHTMTIVYVTDIHDLNMNLTQSQPTTEKVGLLEVLNKVIDSSKSDDIPASSVDLQDTLSGVPPQQAIKKVDPLGSLQTPSKVIDMPTTDELVVSPVDLQHPLSGNIPQQAAEKVDSLGPSEASNKVIDLSAPGDVASPVDPQYPTSSNLPQQAVEKVSPLGSPDAPKKEIDLSAPGDVASPVDLQDPSSGNLPQQAVENVNPPDSPEAPKKELDLSAPGDVASPVDLQHPLSSNLPQQAVEKVSPLGSPDAPKKEIDLSAPGDVASPVDLQDPSSGNLPQQAVENVNPPDSPEAPKKELDLSAPGDVASPVDLQHPLSSNLPQQAVEKVSPLGSPEAPNKVIDLLAPDDVPAYPVDSQNSLIKNPTQQAVEKVPTTSISEASNQVIDLTPPGDFPALVSDTYNPESDTQQTGNIGDLHEDVDSSIPATGEPPRHEVFIEKVEPTSSKSGPGQVIELQVPDEPLTPFQSPEVIIVKVNPPTPAHSSNKIVELPMEGTIDDDESIEEQHPEAIAGPVVIEKVETQEPNAETDKVIDLPDPEIPPPILNTLIEHSSYEVEDNDAFVKKPPPIVTVSSVPNRMMEQLAPPVYFIGEISAREHEDSSQSDEIQNSDSDDEEADEETSLSEEPESIKVSDESDNLSKPQSSEQSASLSSAEQSTIHYLGGKDHIVHSIDNHFVIPLQPNFPSSVEEVESKSDELDDQSELVHQIREAEPGRNQTPNLLVTMLSVKRGNVNIINGPHTTPIVGAHDVHTGYPIDPLKGYNSRDVQCIHNGLYFLPHPGNCQKYFICAYHHLHLHSCGDGLVWNYKRGQCVSESLDSRCFMKNPPKFPEPEIRKPSDPSIDEFTTKVATPTPPIRSMKPNVVTSGSDSQMPSCPGLRQAYRPSYDDCNKYYICILGHPILTSCPDDLHWDAAREFCGEPHFARCARR